MKIADAFPLPPNTGLCGYRDGSAASVCPATLPGYFWMSIIRGSTQEWQRRPVAEMGVPEFLRALGLADLEWRYVHREPSAACPFEREPAGQRAGEVYFARQAGAVGPIKIGWSEESGSRLAALQTGSPVLLEIVATMPGGQAAEARLHRRFAAYRLHGEWFVSAPELLAFIEALP